MSGSCRRAPLKEVNPLLTCPVCKGYFIDATTIVECLHSFCRSCILKYLKQNASCPTCKHAVNTAKPNIKADKTLQDIVYKLVPGLYQKEMRRRQEFYKKHPEHGFAVRPNNHLGGADTATPEQRGEDVSGRLIFAPEDAISLSLEYLPIGVDPLVLLSSEPDNGDSPKGTIQDDKSAMWRRYLRCPALVTIAHLKKFIVFKYDVNTLKFNIDICHKRAPLPEHWTLMDVAYIFAWKRNSPIRFFYRVTPEAVYFERPLHETSYTPPPGSEAEDEKDDTNDKEESKFNVNDKRTPMLPEEKLAVFNSELKIETKKLNNVEKSPEPTMLAKRSFPKESIKSLENDSKTSSLSTSKHNSLVKQVKNPIKLSKKLDGKYQVLQAICKSPPPEFSVVTNGLKMTLKQKPSPGSNSTNGNNSIIGSLTSKIKIVDDVTLGESNMYNVKIQKHPDKQKRKVHFGDTEDQPKSKKQFLHRNFRLTEVSNSLDEKKTTEEQTNNVLKTDSDIGSNQISLNQLKESNNGKESLNDTKKRQSDVKVTSTNIADRLGEAKSSTDSSTQAVSKSNEESQQPIDVYAFPSDPPTALLPGAVKRKCPPGMPLSEMRKKQEQQQKQQQQSEKKSDVNATKTNTPVKCYRNLTKPAVYGKQSPSKNKSSPTTSTNTAVASANSIASPAVSSTSSKVSLTTSLMSNDTRNLLGDCGLNIPASLSITLTAPRPSANVANADSSDLRKDLTMQSIADSKFNPSISLNDRNVNPRVLKAIKSGQIRMPVSNMPGKGHPRSPMQQNQTPVKRKRDESTITPIPFKSLSDQLSNSKNMDLQGMNIPISHNKNIKIRPVTMGWNDVDNVKTNNYKDVNSQVVTLTDGQRYYRAPPGSLTPAAHRMNDMQMPSRTPVYAPSVFSTSPMGPPTSKYHVFPSLQSLHALNQSPSLEQYHMESRLRISPVENKNSTNQYNNNNNNHNNIQANRSSHIAALCAPVKPTRTFAVPIAKQHSMVTQATGLGSPLTVSPTKQQSVNNSSARSDTTSSNADSATTDQIVKKDDDSKEALPKAEKVKENRDSSIDEKSPAQDADSPRVTSTASPSPPPSVGESTIDNTKKELIESSSTSDKCQSTTNSEVANINKSPESPDSSSVVTENAGNLVDSTKPAIEKNKSSTTSDSENKDETSIDKKNSDKDKITNTDKPLEAFQKRFVATFPVSEWGKEGFRNFIDSLPGLQAEAQSKNAKAAE